MGMTKGRAGGMRWTAALILLALSIFGGGRALADEARDALLCEQAIRHGAATVGVPESVLRAIALTETGRRVGGRLAPWPWAVNREGQGYWFANRAEALTFARQSLAERRPSFDLSCFQINYRYHGENFPSLEAMVEPDTAAVYAASFLRDLYAELGDWSLAAGAYHSRTPHYASRYRARFDRILAGLGGSGAPLAGDFVAASAPATAPPRPVPQRQIAGPRIIAIAPAGAAPGDPGPAATDGRRLPVVATSGATVPTVARGGGGRGVTMVTVDAVEAPLVAGRRL
jgi:hypothetical protein